MGQFKQLEAQVKEMRRYVKEYVKSEARKREQAARRIQANYRGHAARSHGPSASVARLRRGRLAAGTRTRRAAGAGAAWSAALGGGGGGGAHSADAVIGAAGWSTAHAARPAYFDPRRYVLSSRAAVSPPRYSRYSPNHFGGQQQAGGSGRRVPGLLRHAPKDAQQIQQGRAARCIQRMYRGFVDRQRYTDYLECQQAAVVIQARWRGWDQRRRLGIGSWCESFRARPKEVADWESCDAGVLYLTL
jgi:hypothetical protein